MSDLGENKELSTQTGIKYWYLRNHQIFSKLTDSELLDLEVQVGFLKIKKNQILKLPTFKDSRIYFLKQGLLKISSHEGKASRTKEVIMKGDIFGEIPGYKNAVESEDCARALSSEAIICTFSLHNFEKILSKNPTLAIAFTKKMGDKIIKIERKYTNLIFMDAKSRLKELLKDLANDHGKIENDSTIVNINLTHQDFADLIGCKRQTLSTVMNELKFENKLDYSRNSLRITNISSL